ncbi:MAG: SPOR domain-containing protein [Thermodesulfobacteriota bacterium]
MRTFSQHSLLAHVTRAAALLFIAGAIFLPQPTRAAEDRERCYSLQLASFDERQAAERFYLSLAGENGAAALRLERIGSGFAVRLGRFASEAEARNERGRLGALSSSALIRPVYYLPERILLPTPPAVRETTATAVTAPDGDEDSPLFLPSRTETAKTVAAAPTTIPGAARPAGEDAGAATRNTMQPAEPAPSSSPLPFPQPAATVVHHRDGGQPAGRSPAPDLAIVAAILGGSLLFSLFAAGEERKEPTVERKTPAGNNGSGQPHLSHRIKGFFEQNRRELSMITANCFSADSKARSFYISSSFNGEGKSTAAVAMAYGIAMDGDATVLLIDGCGDGPCLHETFETGIGPGFTDILCSDLPVDDAIRATAYRNLSLLTFGTGGLGKGGCQHDPLRSALVKELVESLKGRFDYIVFDGHSLLNSPTAAAIAHMFDGLILVVECEKTKWEVAEMAQERVKQIGANLVAVVLNKRRYYIPQSLYNRI